MNSSRADTSRVDEQEGGSSVSLLGLVLRAVLGIYLMVVGLAARRRARAASSGEIILTGTFHSANWAIAHLRPLLLSNVCDRLTIVSTHPPIDLPNLEWIAPPSWLRKISGDAGARLLTLGWLAMKRSPDYVGGFHLLFNGLASIAIAKLLRTRAIYFCVGGPAEVERGGLWSENKVFQRLPRPDYRIESQLIRAAAHADLIVTMGSSAARFYQDRAGNRARVHPGGLDLEQYSQEEHRDIDVLFVGRLAPIKRLDLLVEIIGALEGPLPQIRAAIVGDGPERKMIERRSRELGIESNIELAGFQSDVRPWLARSKVFLLTSDTEGLSLALMEAMASGVCPVVRDVGDLSDLVADGRNGYLVAGADVEAFAARIESLISDPRRLAEFSRAALESSQAYGLSIAAQKWDTMLSRLSGDSPTPPGYEKCAE